MDLQAITNGLYTANFWNNSTGSSAYTDISTKTGSGGKLHLVTTSNTWGSATVRDTVSGCDLVGEGAGGLSVSAYNGDLRLMQGDNVIIKLKSNGDTYIGSGLNSRINSSGVQTKYNAIELKNNGHATEIVDSNRTAQSAAISATTIYAVPASGAGKYRVSYVATITTAASTSSVLGGTNGFQVVYTNNGGDNVVKTTVAGNSVTSTANTTGTAITGSFLVYCKASTNLQYSFGYTSVGATGMQYDISIIVEKL